jgi:hypothetical protein
MSLKVIGDSVARIEVFEGLVGGGVSQEKKLENA